MKKLLVVVVLMVGCQNNPPPTLSPTATLAWQKTRVIKALDVIRDTAIDAETQVPPLITTAETRRIVQAHESILKVMDSPNWAGVAQNSLVEVMQNVSPSTNRLLSPYFALASTLLSIAQEMMK